MALYYPSDISGGQSCFGLMEGQGKSTERITVLHVDGDREVIDRLASHLESHDDRIDVTTAASAGAGLATLDDVEVDAVVAGDSLTDGEGIGFLRTIRETEPEIPVILFTDRPIDDVTSSATIEVITDYLQKGNGPKQYQRLANKIRFSVARERTSPQPIEPEERLSKLAEAANDVLWMFSDDWEELRYVNAAYEDIWGQPKEGLEETPQAFLEGIHPDDRDRVEDAMAQLTAGESVDLEYRVNPDEEYRRWVWVQGEPIVDGAGSVTHVVGFARDVTERHAYERTIENLLMVARGVMQAESADEIAEIVVGAIDDVLELPLNGVWFFDEDVDRLAPVAWTEAGSDVTGQPPSFGPGDGLAWDAFETGETRHYEDVSTVQGRLNPETNIRSEIILPLGDHGVITIGSTDPAAFDEADRWLAQTIAAHAESALDRVEREEEIEAERKFIEQSLNSLDDAFYVVGLDGQLQRWNDRVPEITGYSDDELADKPAIELFPPDEQEVILASIEETLTTGRASVEADVRTADGQRIPYQFIGARLTDTDGTLLGLVGVGRDVSERKAYERDLKRQNERLEEFASLVSHDLRNPLNVAVGRLELLREDVDSEHLATLERSLDRMGELIEDLLGLARTAEGAVTVERTDLATTVEAAWETIPAESATLSVRTDRTIMADVSLLQQLLENLLQNAVDHGGGNVTVTVGQLDDGFYVEDDGEGVSASDREVMFTQGYTTSDAGKGFGLTIVDQVAAAHGWGLQLTDGVAGGARVAVTGVDFASA